ncbi:MAG TPA: pyridoxamine 5'-phosphate oxidase [Steroidobacteraceae bacterium]|nr:pyridoxamine 5'-phosphate oxidase [Steroidobacteraceae bacterium]
MTDMTAPPELLSDPLPADPLQLASQWLAEAYRLGLQPNPNAMTLATSTPAGQPSARVVLCKELVAIPGYLAFYTNYRSRKGDDLAANPRAAAVLYWDYLHRQVRIEGIVVKAPEQDSDAYFASRALQSRIGAWASAQSQPLQSRSQLLAAVAAVARRFGIERAAEDRREPEDQPAAGGPVPRPPHWGGYRLWAEAVELWVEGEARIHDRARWSRALAQHPDGRIEPAAWRATRLQP